MPASPFHHIALAVDAETQAAIAAADTISRERRTRAHQELQQWLAGNHQSNNTYR
jgi:hypothetical protein